MASTRTGIDETMKMLTLVTEVGFLPVVARLDRAWEPAGLVPNCCRTIKPSHDPIVTSRVTSRGDGYYGLMVWASIRQVSPWIEQAPVLR
jgi:hypothetical protein